MDRSAIPTGLTPVYFYELDADDLIVAASDSWDTFAHENEGEHLVFEKIRGTAIWDHITDPETSDLYRRIFAEHFPHDTCAATVPGGPSVACSTPEALLWDATLSSMQQDPSGRAVRGLHASAYA